jgi:hypothetical protein
MSHASVKLLLQDVAKSLADNVQFGYGRRSEFNMITQKRYPYIWLQPLTSNIRQNEKTITTIWSGRIAFMDLDTADADEKQSEVILNRMYTLMERYYHFLDDFFERSTDIIGAITIQSFVSQPFYKDDSGIHTGWFADFQIVTSDNFEYCVPENIDVYAGNV